MGADVGRSEGSTVTTRSRVHEAGRRLARGLGEPISVDSTLEYLTRSAASSIPGFEHASISMRDDDERIRTIAPTGDIAERIDELQYELREGPAYDVIRGDRSTVANFMSDAGANWPSFAPRAVELGIGAMVSLELIDEPGRRAALNLYASQGGTLETDALVIAELFASHASTTLGLVEHIEHLEKGLRSRTTIGQAIGITMERYTLDHDRAFGYLIRLSQDTNVKLRDVAADIVNDADVRSAVGQDDPPEARGQQLP